MIHHGYIKLPGEGMSREQKLDILMEEAAAMEARGNGLAAVTAFERALALDANIPRWYRQFHPFFESN